MTTIDRIAAWMKAKAGEFQMVNPEFATTLTWFSEQLPHLDNPLPNKGMCPDCGSASEVKMRFCKDSTDYRAGYRAIWQCLNPNCGEMEVR